MDPNWELTDPAKALSTSKPSPSEGRDPNWRYVIPGLRAEAALQKKVIKLMGTL